MCDTWHITFSTQQITDAVVTAVLPEGLSLELWPSREGAFLPLAHLSDHLELCPFLLDIHREQVEFATATAPYKLSDVMIVCPKLPSRPTVSLLLMNKTLESMSSCLNTLRH